MKKIKKFLAIVMVFCTVICFNMNNPVLKAAEKQILVKTEKLDNGIICSYYIDETDIESRTYASTFSTTITYTHENTGAQICKIKITGAFEYDRPDGIVRAVSLTYQVTEQNSSYSLSKFYKSLANGNPAKAQLTVGISRNGTYIGDVYPTIWCYNNGTVQYGRW